MKVGDQLVGAIIGYAALAGAQLLAWPPGR